MKKSSVFAHLGNLLPVSVSSFKKSFVIVVAGLLFAINVQAQYTATWALTSNNSFVVAGAQSANVSAGTMVPGTNFPTPGTHNTDGYKGTLVTGSAWPTVPTDGDNIDLPLSPVSGSDLNINTLTLTAKTSGGSDSNILSLAYQVDGTGPWIAFGIPQDAKSGGTTAITFSALNTTFFNAHTYVVRLYIYGESPTPPSSSRSISIKNLVITGTTNTAGTQPTITTDAANSTGKYSASVSGTITAGTIPATASGICWSVNANPALTDNVVSNSPLISSGAFTLPISGLTASTTYHVRSYVTTAAGTVYGSDLTFTTDAPSIPALTTQSASSILSRSAVSGGNLTDSGGVAITAEGVVFNTTGNPTLPGDSSTSDGTSGTSFTSTLLNLLPSTLYYVRAYATNSIGTSYGNEVTFTTDVAVPIILASPSTLNFGNVTINGSSVEGFALSAYTLNPAVDSITISAPTGYQVSTANSNGYSSTIKIPYTDSTIASTTIYVQFAPTVYGAFTGNITIGGGSAPSQTIAVSGNSVQSPSNLSNTGTDFWVGYASHQLMYNGNNTTIATNGGSQKMDLYLSSTQDATVTVTIPGLGYTSGPIAVSANIVNPFTIPNKIGLQYAQLYLEGKSEAGIHITSDVPIVVYAHIFGKFVSGASLLLPTNTWSTDYYAVSTTQVTSSSSSTGSLNYFFVIADADSTPIEITPSYTTLGGRPAGVAFDTVLNAGEIYNMLGAAGTDFTGSHVRSLDCTKKIALFSGSGRTGIASGCNTSPSSDNLFAQVFPRVAWGTKYLTSRTVGTVPQNMFRICVQDTSTNVTLNGVPIDKGTLQANFYYQYMDSLPDVIEADKPIMVAQYCESTEGCTDGSGNNTNGDPEMIFISPVQQSITSATLYSPINQQISFDYINVIIPKAGVSSFTLDGVNKASKFVQHPQDTSYYYATFDGTDNVFSDEQHTLQSSVGFNAIAYGFGNASVSSGGDYIRESYGYNAGTQIQDLTNPLILQNPYGQPANSASQVLTTCKGINFKLAATLPYQTNLITFGFFGNTHISPNTDTTLMGNLVYDSTFTLNGQPYYVYKLPTSYSFNDTGTYSIQITSFDPNTNDGCTGGSNKIVNYNIKVVPGVIPAFAINYNSCVSDTVQLVDQSNGLGYDITGWNWSYNNDLSALPSPSDTIQNPKFANPSNNTANNFTLRAINTFGCFADTTEALTTTTVPPVSFSPLAAICVNADSIDLKDSVSPAGGTFSGRGVSDSGEFTPGIAGAGPDTLTYTYTLGGACSHFATQIISVKDTQHISITPVAALCTNSPSIVLTATPVGGDFNGTGVSGSTFNPSVSAGTYPITYTFTGSGCNLPDTIQIVVNDTPAVDAGPSLTDDGTGVTILATGSASTYLWSPATGLSDATQLDPRANPQQTTTYTLTATTAGCHSVSSMTITLTTPCLDPVNVITPNGDNIHDTWSVGSLDCQPKSVQVDVYNRWGELVFHSDNYDNSWDGTYKGTRLPEATYYYVVKAVMNDGTTPILTGNVTIIR